MMQFTEMPYERPDPNVLIEMIRKITAALKNAADINEAKKAFQDMDELDRQVTTLRVLSSVRHSLNTKDEYYDAEEKFWNKAMPEIREYIQQYNIALTRSSFSEELRELYGDVVFKNIELNVRSFDPEMIPYLQKEKSAFHVNGVFRVAVG